MSERNPDNNVERIGEQIFAQFKSDVGDAWENRLSPEERTLLTDVAEDAAAVLLLALSGRDDDARRERAHVDAQLQNMVSIEATRSARQLWAAVDRAMRRAIAIALAMA